MVTAIEIIMNILIYMNLYWYVFLFTFVPGIYYIFIKIVTFPLSSNKAHEFVIIAKPEKVKIKKVSSRFHPFFEFKNGIYWFSKPCNDVNSYSKYHVYIEGINQDVTELERRENKLNEIIENEITSKQLVGHQIRIPRKIKEHLNRHYVITLDPYEKIAQITPTKEPQPFRVSFYHTLGIYIQERKQKEENEQNEQEEISVENNSGQNQVLLTELSNEVVIKQITYVQNYNYYSSSSAFRLWKKRLKMDRMFVNWVKGSLLDPKIMGAMIIMIAAISASVVLLLMLPGAMLGEMPTG